MPSKTLVNKDIPGPLDNEELDKYFKENPIEEVGVPSSSDMPEAKSSVSYTLISKDGFSLIFTCRSSDEAELLELMSDLEASFISRGYQADRKAKPVQLPIDTSEKCPKCGKPLVKFETKVGKSGLRCSTNVWDSETKTASGCDYIKWNDTPNSTGTTVGATEAQTRLLKEKNQWEEGMTKAEASRKISMLIGK